MTVSLEVVNFEQEMRRIENEVAQLANLEISARIDYAVAQLRIVTPVDTGEARSGWSATKFKDFNGYVTGIIENPVEHIEYLNKGSSQQAPAFFIEQVLSTIGLISPI